MITQEKLKERLDYDPKTGIFRWRELPVFSRIPSGSIAGTKSPQGYILININYRLTMAHRLAWLYIYGTWPENDLDHINGVRFDNRIVNLRPATRSQNNANSRPRRKNMFKGVYLEAGRWRARICLNRKHFHLGRFDTKEEAHNAYAAAARKLFGPYHRLS